MLELWAFLSMIGGIFTGEYFLKNHIEEKEDESVNRPALFGLIRIRKYHNYGAALDMGERNPRLIAAVSVGLCVFASIIFAATFATKGSELLKTGLALLLGGAYSNTYDRMKRKYVVDYVSFPVKWKFFRNVVFNISDFCIIIGAMISVIGS